MNEAENGTIKSHRFVFIGGLHRSGTSLMHEIIKSHPEVSGFENIGVSMDEGQFLQSVYLPAKAYGGPGEFAFDPGSHMDELHPLATEENAKRIFVDWSKYFDLEKKVLVEKSPPNLIRTRFLQKLFPESRFIIMQRHPIAVAYATHKWKKHISIARLIDHALTANEIFEKDRKYLRKVCHIKYEDLVKNPKETMESIWDFLDLARAVTYRIFLKISIRNILKGGVRIVEKKGSGPHFRILKSSLGEWRG
jgi:hypothetical protein